MSPVQYVGHLFDDITHRKKLLVHLQIKLDVVKVLIYFFLMIFG